MKMRQHSAHRAWVSRKHRRFIEFEAEFRRWERELDSLMSEVTDVFVRAFVGAAGPGWSQEGRD